MAIEVIRLELITIGARRHLNYGDLRTGGLIQPEITDNKLLLRNPGGSSRELTLAEFAARVIDLHHQSLKEKTDEFSAHIARAGST